MKCALMDMCIDELRTAALGLSERDQTLYSLLFLILPRSATWRVGNGHPPAET